MSARAETSTRLTGRPLILLRGIWLLYVGLLLVLILATLPARLATVPAATSPSQNWTDAEYQAGLRGLGLDPDGYAGFEKWINLAILVPYWVPALLIFWRRSDDWMALLTSWVLVSLFSSSAMGALVSTNPAWTSVQNVFDSLSTAVLLLWLVIFPDGRLVPGWMRWTVLVHTAVQGWRIFNPEGYQAVAVALMPFIFGTVLIAQVYRYTRDAGPEQKRQIKWVVFGLTAGLTPLVLFLLTFGIYESIAAFLLGNLLWTLFIFILPVSITLAILRSRLFDIDILIRRTLIYSVLTGALLGVYFGSVVLLQGLFRELTGAAQSELVKVISTLTIAALSIPLRQRVQRAIDRRFYRRKYDAAKTLAAFGATARDEVDLRRLSEELVTVVRDTMQPESVSLWLRVGDRRPWTADRRDASDVVRMNEATRSEVGGPPSLASNRGRVEGE